MVLVNLHQLRIEWHRVSCNGYQERQGLAWLDIFPWVLSSLAPVASSAAQWNDMGRQPLCKATGFEFSYVEKYTEGVSHHLKKSNPTHKPIWWGLCLLHGKMVLAAWLLHTPKPVDHDLCIGISTMGDARKYLKGIIFEYVGASFILRNTLYNIYLEQGI